MESPRAMASGIGKQGWETMRITYPMSLRNDHRREYLELTVEDHRLKYNWFGQARMEYGKRRK